MGAFFFYLGKLVGDFLHRESHFIDEENQNNHEENGFPHEENDFPYEENQCFHKGVTNFIIGITIKNN